MPDKPISNTPDFRRFCYCFVRSLDETLYKNLDLIGNSAETVGSIELKVCIFRKHSCSPRDYNRVLERVV